MKKYIHKNNLKNLFCMIFGVILFFTSFHVGEESLIGGIFHLAGCALFCASIHSKWCHTICEEECKHE